MKTDFSKLPREEIEARITTMLLGEMAPDEAGELMDFVAGDSELLRIHDELRKTISLVSEATEAVEHAGLSDGRREALLREFKVVRPVEMDRDADRRLVRPWFAVAAAVIAGLFILSGLMLPSLSKSKSRSTRMAMRRHEMDQGRLPVETASSQGRSETVSQSLASAPAAGDRFDKQVAQIAPTRIELPTTANDEPALQAKNQTSSFADGRPGEQPPGQSRGFLVETGGRYGDLKADETKGIALGDAPTIGLNFKDADSANLPGVVAAKDGAQVGANGIAHLPTTALGFSGPREGNVRGRGLVEKLGEAAPGDGVQNMGSGMGGGGIGGLNYYMSNPGLMKRYFPQMYEQMQKGNGAGGGIGGRAGDTAGMAGFPGVPAVRSVDDGMAGAPAPGLQLPPVMMEPQPRFGQVLPPDLRAQSEAKESAPAARSPQGSPEQQVALETEVKLLREETETLRQSKDFAKKSQLSAANGKSSTMLGRGLAEVDQVARNKGQVDEEVLRRDVAAQKPAAPAPTPQPEVSTAENAFSTFSLNVSDVSFKLAAASLEKGLMPEAASVRSEEFINAFDYHDPEPQGAPVGFAWERARYPFAQDRDLLRLSVKTAASGRQAGRPLNIVLLLDSSGSMERADRVRIVQECLKTLAGQLRPEDRISVVTFARTARLWIDGMPGSQANELPQRVGNLTPEGGTNLEEAMKVAYDTARKHFMAGGVNRVVLLTDGAANLGDVQPDSLKKKVEMERGKGIALDCFGVGWEGLNDELLEALSRNGDGRYGFVNTAEAAGTEFAGQLAGALNVAASDVKVQVEWNPKRVTAYRQIGYAKHQLTKEQFRDNTVDAAEIGAAEAGNALYVVQVNAAGEGPLGTVRVRFKVPGTNDYREHAWPLNYEGAPKNLEGASYALRLAGTASAFSEWLVSSPYAQEVTSDRLLTILSGVPEHFAPDPRPKKLEWMIRQAKSLAGK